MKATFFKYQLQFKQASGTSRGVLTSKDTWFLKIQDANQMGIGECGMFRGLSCDDRPDFADKLDWVCENIKLGQEALLEEPPTSHAHIQLQPNRLRALCH